MGGFFPMIDLKLRPHRRVIPAGTELWRVHLSRYAADEFNPRLADIHFHGGRFDGTVLDQYHSLYLAESALTALAESVLRSRPFDSPAGDRTIPYRAVWQRSLSCVRTRADLVLVSLVSGADLAAVCQDATLLEDESNYARARRWSSEIRAQASDAMGLVWESRRNRSEHAMVLYHDRCAGPDGPPLEVLPDRGIPDLGSQEGRARANELLAPLWARIAGPEWP
ncbi:RES family NAD+ phosphorylase [Streptomyces sp. NRRL S-1022]|uniref:RES family NAD+ phosphorylase n=1 Tax=Streptomyces sp. NRRL S-1022 TaxID=1463880 RepID=UPI0004C101F1|nr:RES family NAD+ phosphorylase [Streptomyces sp. NRRL S-1022]